MVEQLYHENNPILYFSSNRTTNFLCMYGRFRPVTAWCFMKISHLLRWMWHFGTEFARVRLFVLTIWRGFAALRSAFYGWSRISLALEFLWLQNKHVPDSFVAIIICGRHEVRSQRRTLDSWGYQDKLATFPAFSDFFFAGELTDGNSGTTMMTRSHVARWLEWSEFSAYNNLRK